jgi:hypothetical protein
MEKGRFDKAFNALCRLRKHKIQATRDMYYAYKLLEVEQVDRAGRSLWKEFFFVRRNRRAAQSSFFVMFMQQFCGVNVIAYYSKPVSYTIHFIANTRANSVQGSSIFEEAGFSRSEALLTSMGTGITNFLFAIPAIYTIDTFGMFSIWHDREFLSHVDLTRVYRQKELTAYYIPLNGAVSPVVRHVILFA